MFKNQVDLHLSNRATVCYNLSSYDFDVVSIPAFLQMLQ